jgi:hypothetical protein
MSKIYGNIRAIASGYATEGGDLYKNEQILQDIISALDYMHENYYSRREENIFSNDNWWDWEIGTPENLLEALVCIADDISQKLIDKYLEPINRYDPYPSMTMSNRINIAYCSIISAVLQKDYKRIAISIEMFRECFDTVEKLDGFYDDGSFIQHNYISYLGEYGVEMMTPLTILSYSLDESVFRLDDEMKQYQALFEQTKFYQEFQYSKGDSEKEKLLKLFNEIANLNKDNKDSLNEFIKGKKSELESFLYNQPISFENNKELFYCKNKIVILTNLEKLINNK